MLIMHFDSLPPLHHQKATLCNSTYVQALLGDDEAAFHHLFKACTKTIGNMKGCPPLDSPRKPFLDLASAVQEPPWPLYSCGRATKGLGMGIMWGSL